jgi:myo-inositol-1(or 4)-monophosphatase
VRATDADLQHISEALDAADELLGEMLQRRIEVGDKGGGDPVTEADLAVDRLLREMLPNDDEGWLSEETEDDPARLGCRRVWIVDPIDGTREFVAGIPEWGVLIGLCVDGVAVAGGFLNPISRLKVVGGVGLGCTANGESSHVADGPDLAGAKVLASRSEIRRGEWERFEGLDFEIEPMGSVAHKLALVAAGLGDATWTLAPKNEWDVAGGVALVHSAGGAAVLPDGAEPRFNQRRPRVSGLIACGRERLDSVLGTTTAR